MKRYEYLEHTADLGILAYGEDLRELFENAAQAMFDALADTETVSPDREYPIEAEAATTEDLLVHWLSELLYQHEVREVLFAHVRILEITPTHLRAIAYGEPSHPRHARYTEIKNVTYHQLQVRQSDRGWEAQVILDI